VESSDNESSDGITTRAGNISYYCAPGVDTYTPNSSSSVIIGSTCNTASNDGGVIRAKATNLNGDQITIQITKQDQLSFAAGATGYIKAGSLCGDPFGGGISYNMQMFGLSKTVTIPSFTRGIQHLYPMVISGSSRLYAEPVMVYTDPMYNSQTPYTHGQVLGTVNGVEVRANGTNNQTTASGYNNQCTEFCIRYYSQVYSKSISSSSMGNATSWFNNSTTQGLSKFSNGGGTDPRPGDILCMSGGIGGLGHVAIIIQVTSSFIKIAHQNSGTSWAPIGAQISRNGSTVSNPSDYTVWGWLRIPSY
jgi:hypothetical protein